MKTGTPAATSPATDFPPIGDIFSDSFQVAEESEPAIFKTIESLLAWFSGKLTWFLRAETRDSSVKHIRSELE